LTASWNDPLAFVCTAIASTICRMSLSGRRAWSRQFGV
jgi:hypothetical protein